MLAGMSDSLSGGNHPAFPTEIPEPIAAPTGLFEDCL